MNRREFLARAECLPIAAAASGLTLPLGGCIGFHYVSTSVANNRLVVRLEDLGDRHFALLDAPGLALPLYLFRRDDGSWSAVSTRCMHRGCQVEPADGHLVCPCHGSEYSNTGEVLKGPTQRPLRALTAVEDGDRVLIELPEDRSGW
ncbi:MAG: Rieske (2Fe-2S) protein [Gemmatimonadales bacterium]|nr:Rieske (2Fe-2S) protein [Gemmatimonadales bacterium]